MIKITNNAIDFLKKNMLLETEAPLVVYVSISYPYTQYAYVNITYCKEYDLNKNDILIDNYDVKIYINEKTKNLLDQSIIDVKNTILQINAPNLLKSKIHNENNIKEKLTLLLETEINTILSQHGGFIELIDICNDTITIKFHGGCQGCGMVNFTMNNYIEKVIKKNFPEIKNIKDATAHEIRKNSYY